MHKTRSFLAHAALTGLLCLPAAALLASGTGRAAGPAPPARDPAARSSAEAPAAVHQELAGMRRSLDEIAVLLAATLDQQEVAVLMTRMELKQRRLLPLQEMLERARGDRRGVQEEAQRLRDMEEMFARDAGANENPPEQMNFERERLERELKLMETRLATLDQRIIELEDDLADHQNDIAILEEMVDERLGLR